MRLVVDACVLQSAGTTEAPCSQACRLTLLAITGADHVLHYDSILEEEWRNHTSTFSRKWRAMMLSRRRLEFVKTLKSTSGLRRAVTTHLADHSAHKAALKDVHLVALALQADESILSRDGTARGLFATISEGETRLRKLLWIDPTQQPNEALAWLRNESEPLDDWRLK